MNDTRGTRRHQTIRTAAQGRGYTVSELTWTPLYVGGEMEGMCGGWELWIAEDPGYLWAPNVDAMLTEIARLAPINAEGAIP